MTAASDWLTETVKRLEGWPRQSVMVIARVEHLRGLVAERAWRPISDLTLGDHYPDTLLAIPYACAEDRERYGHYEIATGWWDGSVWWVQDRIVDDAEYWMPLPPSPEPTT